MIEMEQVASVATSPAEYTQLLMNYKKQIIRDTSEGSCRHKKNAVVYLKCLSNKALLFS